MESNLQKQLSDHLHVRKLNVAKMLGIRSNFTYLSWLSLLLTY